MHCRDERAFERPSIQQKQQLQWRRCEWIAGRLQLESIAERWRNCGGSASSAAQQCLREPIEVFALGRIRACSQMVEAFFDEVLVELRGSQSMRRCLASVADDDRAGVVDRHDAGGISAFDSIHRLVASAIANDERLDPERATRNRIASEMLPDADRYRDFFIRPGPVRRGLEPEVVCAQRESEQDDEQKANQRETLSSSMRKRSVRAFAANPRLSLSGKTPVMKAASPVTLSMTDA